MITKFFSNNSALKSHDSLSSQAQGSSQQAIISSEQILSEFDLIEESENPQEELRKLISKYPSVLEDDYPNCGKLVFYAIEKDKLKTLDAILDKYPQAIDQLYRPFGKPVFYAIYANKIKALEKIIKKYPQTLNQDDPPYGRPILHAIANNIDALKKILELSPNPAFQDQFLFNKPVYFAIEKRNNEALKAILEAYPEALNFQDPRYKTLHEFAIEKRNNEALKAILEAYPKALNFQDPRYKTLHEFAIEKRNNEALKAILEAYPKALNFQDPQYKTLLEYARKKNNFEAIQLIQSQVVINEFDLIEESKYPQQALKNFLENNPNKIGDQSSDYVRLVFYAIEKNKLKTLDAILKIYPGAIDHELEKYGKAIFFALYWGKVDALKIILKVNNGEALNHQKLPFGNPTFYAILNFKSKSLQYILENYPGELTKTRYGHDPFEFSCIDYVRYKQSGSQEDIGSIKSIINVIYQAQCKTKVDLDDEDFKRLEVFIKKFSHIKLGYSNERFGTDSLSQRKIYQELLADRSSSLGESNDFDRFSETSLSTLKSINNFENPIATSEERLFIFLSDLKDHSSYFVFHVNSSDNLTGISYCDGNTISSNDLLNSNKAYLRGGVRKFKLNPEIKFSKEFVDNFLASNSKDKNMHEFYQQLSKEGLKVVDPEKPSSIQALSISDNSILDYEIPTKKQTRGNCISKSKSILERYVAKLLNPQSSFSSREAGLNTPSSSSQPQSLEGDGTSLFKQFKGQFTISQIEDLLKLKQDLSEADQQKPFNQFLTQRIDKILLMVNQKAKKKIEKKQGIFKSKDLAIHRRIAQLTEGSTKTEIEEMPIASCFDGKDLSSNDLVNNQIIGQSKENSITRAEDKDMSRASCFDGNNFSSNDLAINQKIPELTETSITRAEDEDMSRASCFAVIFKRLGFNSKKNKEDQSKPNSSCFRAIAKILKFKSNIIEAS